MGKLDELLTKQFGISTRAIENPLVSSVGTSAVKILDNNADRLAWVIINLSSNTLYLSLKSDVSSSKAIVVSPNGGFASMVWDEDFQMTGWEIWGVASGLNSAIYVLEVVATK
jgi:hypothetical protein